MPNVALTVAVRLVPVEAEHLVTFFFFAAHAPQPHPNYKRPRLFLPYVSSSPVFKKKTGTHGCTIRILQIQVLGYLPGTLSENPLPCSLGT